MNEHNPLIYQVPSDRETSNQSYKAGPDLSSGSGQFALCGRVPPARFERTTYGLGIRCSILLSYGGNLFINDLKKLENESVYVWESNGLKVFQLPADNITQAVVFKNKYIFI